jgi:ParB family chromosome partitioning protein
LSAGHGRALLSANNINKLIKIVLKQGLNVRQTEKLVKKENAGKSKLAPQTLAKDSDTLALERDISDTLGLKVDITFNAGRGALTIHYTGLSQLDDILARLSRKQKPALSD